MSISSGTRHATPTPEGSPSLTASGRPVNVSAYPPHPIVKAPPWKWMIPAYFFLGGAAGAAATLSLGAGLSGNRMLARRSLVASVLAFIPCAPLLIADLGRPERFYNMLRVFRPTSPMNLGTWVLTGFGAALSAAVVGRTSALLRPLEWLGAAGAGLLGPVLCTYTAVLVANTSTPVWHAARRTLPLLFAAGAMSSGGAAACITTPARDAAAARRLAVAGGIGEVVASRLMKQQLGPLASSYDEGQTATISKAAEVATLGGAALMLAFGRWRPVAVVASAAILAGACAERLAVWRAGIDSANRT